ncbi:unnamed protein product [Arabidopsis lyrata]|nr:unnamed protein product [Arabidopsis lyrata]
MEETTTFHGLGHLFFTIFLYCFSSFIVAPAITDISMAALCPGKDECSLAIYLSGFQQVITGVGSLMMMPLMGSLSDKHGRKCLLTLPMTLHILPLATLAYSTRGTTIFYMYYVLKTSTSIVCEGTVFCLALAYVHGIAKSDAFLASEAEAEAESQGIARNRLGIAIPKVRRLEACWNRTIRDWKHR